MKRRLGYPKGWQGETIFWPTWHMILSYNCNGQIDLNRCHFIRGGRNIIFTPKKKTFALHSEKSTQQIRWKTVARKVQLLWFLDSFTFQASKYIWIIIWHCTVCIAHLQRFGNIKGEAKLDARDCLSLGAVQCARVENVSGVSYSQPRLKAVSTQALA